jgi:hypothetical protein
MYRKTMIVIVTALALVGFDQQARAQSPHFISANDALASIDEPKPTDLSVSWKEAGLGNNQLIGYTASADATATYACINNGGNHPQASNKTSVSGPVSASGTFSSGMNGQITASLNADEPESTNFCPGGQSFVLASVSYTGVQLCDTTDSLCESLPALSQTFCDLDTLTRATVKNCVAITDDETPF